VEGNNLHKIAKGSWKLLLAGKGTCVCRGRHRERERERGAKRERQRERKREKTHTDTTVQRFLVKACFFYFLGFFLFSRK